MADDRGITTWNAVVDPLVARHLQQGRWLNRDLRIWEFEGVTKHEMEAMIGTAMVAACAELEADHLIRESGCTPPEEV